MANDEAILLDDETIEGDTFNIYFYQSKKFLETEDLSYCLTGNAPIIVDKDSGNIVVTGTAEEPIYYINSYNSKVKQQKTNKISHRKIIF